MAPEAKRRLIDEFDARIDPFYKTLVADYVRQHKIGSESALHFLA